MSNSKADGDALKALAEYRDAIDIIDRGLVTVLNSRTRMVEEIGRIKEAMNLPVYEPKREDDVFRNVVEHNQGPLTSEALKRIFERIIDEMRSLQKMRRQGEN